MPDAAIAMAVDLMRKIEAPALAVSAQILLVVLMATIALANALAVRPLEI